MSTSKRRHARQTRALYLEVMEDRVVPDVVPITPPGPGEPPIAVDDHLGYNILQTSSTLNVLANDLNTPDASWVFSSPTVVTAPQFGRVTLDADTGIFLYTQDVPPQGGQYPQDTFTYHVTNTLGLQSNTATVTVSPVAAEKANWVVAHPDIGFTRSLQPVVIDLLANDELRNNPTKRLQPGEISDWEFDFGSVQLNLNSPEFSSPKHGTVTFDPTTGAATYTPDFGYIGWDRFAYEVSTLPGRPDGPAPGVVHTDSDEGFVIIDAAPPRLQPDPNGGGQMLVVDGTHTADIIDIVPGDRKNQVRAIVNGVASPSFRPTSRIVVFGYSGDDTITVSPRVRTPAWLIGGLGNDVLTAGRGSALLMGSEGNDTLTGSKDRDFLIGGLGEDYLSGSFSSDLLVGGTTTMDQQPEDLGQQFDTWQRKPWPAKSQQWRESHDRLTDTDVLDDSSKDSLKGGPGRDLILGANGVRPDDVIDSPNGKHNGKDRGKKHC